MSSLQVMHVVIAGCLIGAQLVWTLAVIPSYRHLSLGEYLRVHSLLTWYGDALMPFLGVSTTVVGFLRYRQTGEWSALVAALALTLAGIAARRNLHINHRMRDIEVGLEAHAVADDAVADELLACRKRWATQHFIRNVGGAIAFAFALVPASSVTLGRPGRWPVGWMDAVLLVVAVMSGRELLGHVRFMQRDTRRLAVLLRRTAPA